MVLFGGGHAWFYLGGCVHGFIWGLCMVLFGGGMRGFILGGMRGFIRGACVVLFGGACVVLFGGAWFYPGGVCMVFYSGGMCGFIQGGRVWFYLGGHVWFYLGVMRGFLQVGMRGFSGGGVRGFFSFFGYNEIRSMSGRYASYWNAFLLILKVFSSLFGDRGYVNQLKVLRLQYRVFLCVSNLCTLATTRLAPVVDMIACLHQNKS